MRILLTNDDGINAPGLATLTDIATDLAGPGGEVWVVAPAFEQSGVAHCISYTRPIMISEMGPRRFAVDGAPADCVMAGLHQVLKDSPPDLILSGVNRGNNSAENALYSGTLGAALEGALQGHKAVALSQYYGPGNVGLENPFEAAAHHGADVLRKLLRDAPWGGDRYQLFYNVNFPALPGDQVKGTKVTPQGMRPGVNFTTEPFTAPSGRQFLWIRGGNQQAPALPDTCDAAANLDGYISVTPMRADFTDHDTLAQISALFP